MNTNKYGESRRVLEADDDGDNHMSIKQRQSEKIEKLGTFATGASVFKAFVGLGVLNLPYQFWETGIAVFPTFLIGILIMTLYCTSLMLECALEHGDSYSEIAKAAYGNKMKVLVEILIIGSQIGFCTNYCYFIMS
jgi:amino acid permease